MKKIITLIALFAMTSAFALIAPVGRSVNLTVAGGLVNGSLEQHFVNVKNSSAAVIVAGKVVSADLTAQDGFSVIIAPITLGTVPICVMVTPSCAVGALCKCQKYGIYSGAAFDVTGASAVAGQRWYISGTTAGSLSARSPGLATEQPGGFFYNAQAASAAVKVFINL